MNLYTIIMLNCQSESIERSFIEEISSAAAIDHYKLLRHDLPKQLSIFARPAKFGDVAFNLTEVNAAVDFGELISYEELTLDGEYDVSEIA